MATMNDWLFPLSAIGAFFGGLGLGMAFDRQMSRRAISQLTAGRAGKTPILQSPVLQPTADGVVSVDGRGLIRAFNPAAERIFGYRADEVVGRNVAMRMPEPHRSRHDSYMRRYLDGGPGHIIGIGREVEGQRKDGSTFPMDLTVSEGRSAGEHLFTGILRDLSETRRRETEDAPPLDARFLAAAGHDLRQPVQAIVFLVSLLSQKLRGQPAQAIVRDLHEAIESLEILLDSLLDVARLEAGMVTPRQTDFAVATVLDRLAGEFRPLAADKGLQLRLVPSGGMVRSDPTLLLCILRHLLSNAVRYTPRGRILLGCRHRRDRLRIEIHDTGIGIPPKHRQEIFEDFARLGPPEHARGRRLGLGLAVVRRLARLLGHRLTLDSTPGKGSVFAVEVAAAALGSGRSRRRARAAASPPARSLIMLIDDEPMGLKGMSLLLQTWGYDVLAAESEEQALEALNRGGQKPNAILADYRLREGHTGTEAIQHIRARFDTPIPSIIITGDTAPERLREVEDTGLPILHKPVRPPALREVLRETLADGRIRPS